MLCLKLTVILALFTASIRGDCAASDNPRRIIECIRYITSGLYGAVVKDLRIVCDIAKDMAQCLSEELSGCIAEQLGVAALNEVKVLAKECCPERNTDKCPLRDSNILNQKCFAADSLVTLSNGQQKNIADLQSGDSLLAYDDRTKQIITTSFITMMHYQPRTFALFKHITTNTGQKLSLTASHLLPTPHRGYVMAKHVRTGMNIYVMNEYGMLVNDTVSNVSDVVRQGYVAPLTDEGTLIVNSVAASCYATIESHRAAHAVVAPMRWWYRLFGGETVTRKTREEGVHWFPKMLYDMTALILPSIIHQ